MVAKPKAPEARINWRGVMLNRKTALALEWAERQCGLRFEPSQGSWSDAVSASGSTHSGSGAVDLRCVIYDKVERRKGAKALKDAGFAMWERKEVPGLWGEHWHLILIFSENASTAAKWQVQEYLEGRDGLTGRRRDPSYRPDPLVKFDGSKRRPVPID